jgi:hypothetical protein
MRALSAAQLLDVWEQGQGRPLPQWALLLLAAACPDTPADGLAKLSIGQRDARLLTLREWTFGPQVAALAACPQCAERLELTFQVGDVRGASPAWPELCQKEDDEGDAALTVEAAGWEVQFRLPNGADLAAMPSSQEGTAAQQVLLGRCLLAVKRNGQDLSTEQLPEEVADQVVDRMAQADPQANIQLALSCPVCGQQWQAVFDIVSFFWSEINAWACRTLREVHALASAYGWREADILAMSSWRRQAYLELVGPS